VASEKIKQTAEQFKKATEKIGETVSETLKGAAENEFVKGSKEKVCAQYVTTTWTTPVILLVLSLSWRFFQSCTL
jgi:import inner membrane translocase subunit TIM44